METSAGSLMPSDILTGSIISACQQGFRTDSSTCCGFYTAPSRNDDKVARLFSD